MNYYYLIAGLPDLYLQQDQIKIDFAATYELIERNLEPQDLLLYQFLLRSNDNANLLAVIFQEVKQWSVASYRLPAVIEEEVVRDYRRHLDRLPNYQYEFLRIYGEQFTEMSMGSIANRLQELFYETIRAQQDPFLHIYFEFKRHLEAILAAYHHARYPDLPEPGSFPDGALVRQIGPGKSISSRLARAYPYIERLLEILDGGDPREIEKEVDRITWQFVDNLEGSFDLNRVMGYVVKLMIIERQDRLNRAMKEDHLAKLTEEIEQISRYPKTQPI